MKTTNKFILFFTALLLISPFPVIADEAPVTKPAPATPTVPVNPATPVAPATPTVPVNPATPQAPATPTKPATPATPVPAANTTTPASTSTSTEYVRGIYVTQPMLETTKKINYLIKRAKETGINTFVVDIERKSKMFDRNIKLLKENNINYIARLVVFPDGGTPDKIASKAYWQKRFQLAEYAASHGAHTVQLDYIRYNTKQKGSPENAKNILKVINYFRENLAPYHTQLEIAIFGEVSFGPSIHIGQDMREFYTSVHSIAPMVYPSHYYPYVYHSQRPYETIYDSLTTLKQKFNNDTPFKIYAYIEVWNVRFHLGNGTKRMAYIYNELKAVQDSGVNGWYAWSANNKYDSLFDTLQHYKKELR